MHFGAPEEVNFGRGSQVTKTERSGDDLIVTFEGKGNGFTDENFAGKLLGKTSEGELLFGYARLPWVEYIEPALSARLPKISIYRNSSTIEIEVQNFGQVESMPTDIKIEYEKDGQLVELASDDIAKLNPFEKTTVNLKGAGLVNTGKKIDVKVSILPEDQKPIEFHGNVQVYD